MSYILDEQDLKIVSFYGRTVAWESALLPHSMNVLSSILGSVSQLVTSTQYPDEDLDPVSGTAQRLSAAPHERTGQIERTNFTVHRNIPYMWKIKYLSFLTFYTTVSHMKAFLVGQEGIPRMMLWSTTALRLSPSCITLPYR